MVNPVAREQALHLFLLSTGGFLKRAADGAVLDSAELLDAPSRRKIASGLYLGSGRQDQTARLLADGRVLLSGGEGRFGDALDYGEAFDPAAQPDPALERSWGRWETAANEILEKHDDLRLVARMTRSQPIIDQGQFCSRRVTAWGVLRTLTTAQIR